MLYQEPGPVDPGSRYRHAVPTLSGLPAQPGGRHAGAGRLDAPTGGRMPVSRFPGPETRPILTPKPQAVFQTTGEGVGRESGGGGGSVEGLSSRQHGMRLMSRSRGDAALPALQTRV